MADRTSMHSSVSLAAQDPPSLALVVALSAAAIHAGLAVVFYQLGAAGLAHFDVVGAAVHLVGAAFIIRGRRVLGLWIVLGSGVPHGMVMTVALGLASGWGYYVVVTVLVPYLFFREHPRHMGAAVSFSIAAGICASVGTLIWDPWVVVGDRVLETMHIANLMSVLVAMAGTGALIIKANRHARRRMSRLHEEVQHARRLGQYTLGKKLGVGGMGQVYRAKHALLRRPAAIKLIRDGHVTEAALQRFEQEVQLTSQLTHPNTVAIYDYGRTPQGVFYYVMEYLDGLDLQALVEREGPVPAGRVIHIVRQVCEALEEAHARGLVHRDIKPSNIFICRRGERPDFAKVLDFGLVMDLKGPHEAAADVITGTPAYLAPEAISDPDQIGPATDLYALGAVAYFLLCGHEVFEGATITEVCAAHLYETPPPLRDRADVEVPAALEDAIRQCLEKHPADRPPSAHALRRVLDAVALATPWSEDAARAWWARHQAAAPAVARPAAKAPTPGLTVDVDLAARHGLSPQPQT